MSDECQSSPLRKGKVYSVEFWDHVDGASSPLKFVVHGRLSKVTRTFIVIECWHYAGKCRNPDANVQRYTIVRKAIARIARLQEISD